MSYLYAKKSLGQHFLKNASVAHAIVEAGGVKEGDVVLEIGPGTGVLTRMLLEKGVEVIAVEADDRAIELLNSDFKEAISRKALTIIHADIREITLASLGLSTRPFKVIANIPYYISGYLFRTLLSGPIQPSMLVFLVQKEVADRIVKSKKESLLSLSIKAYGTPRYVQTVARGNFAPVPGVDSAVLAISDISRKNFTNLDESWLFTILHAGFAAKRKQLFGALKQVTKQEELETAFKKLNLDLKVRGEDVSIETWLELAKNTELT